MREEIATFDARNIPKEIRESVEELLSKNRTSFDPKVIPECIMQNEKRKNNTHNCLPRNVSFRMSLKLLPEFVSIKR